MGAGSAQSVVLLVARIGFSGISRLLDMHMDGMNAGSAQSVAFEVVGVGILCTTGLCDMHMIGMCAVWLVLLAVVGVVAGECASLVGV